MWGLGGGAGIWGHHTVLFHHAGVSRRPQARVWTSLPTMLALPRGPPGGILAHCKSWHRCWSSNSKPKSTTTPHRRVTCPSSRSYWSPYSWEGALMEGGSPHLPGVINPGSVHCSLLERRDLWRREAEARQHSQPDPAMPPGHTRMPENQRLETLSSLLQSEYAGKGSWLGNPPGTVHPCPAFTVPGAPVGQSQLLRELVLLPAGADSLRAQSHRAELDRKLVQVEEAIKIFSRPKVFVKMDS